MTREQRDVLREAVVKRIYGWTDLDVDKLGQRARDVLLVGLSLLTDLGWEQSDPHERYILTMPEEELERVVREMRKEAEDSLEDNSKPTNVALIRERTGYTLTEEDFAYEETCRRRSADEDLDLLLACDAVLSSS